MLWEGHACLEQAAICALACNCLSDLIPRHYFPLTTELSLRLLEGSHVIIEIYTHDGLGNLETLSMKQVLLFFSGVYL